ncbi:MAG: DUF3352 domain-containing protein [Bacteroidia bacterium]
MKRVVGSSLFILFLLIAVAAALFYIQRNYNIIGGKPENAIPVDAAFFIRTDFSSGVINKLLQTSYWQDIQDKSFYRKVHKNLVLFDSLITANEELKKSGTKEPLFISAHVVKANEMDWLFIINIPISNREKFADEIIKILCPANSEINERNYEDVDIKELSINENKIFTYAISKNIFIGSFTSFLVEDAIRQQQAPGSPMGNDKAFNEIYSRSKNIHATTIFINYRNLPGWLSVFINDEKLSSFNTLGQFASWSAHEIGLTNQTVFAQGLINAQDTLAFTAALTKQQPVEIELLKILPRKTSLVSAVGLSNKEIFFKTFESVLNNTAEKASRQFLLKKIEREYKFSPAQKFYNIAGNEFALLITEPASINYANNTYLILKTADVQKAKKTMQSICNLVNSKQNQSTWREDYDGIQIGLVRLTGLIPALFGSQFKKLNNIYFSFIGKYIVFANQPSSLHSLIDDYNEKNLLTKESSFRSVSVKLSWKTNYFYYCRLPSSRYLLKSVLSETASHHFDSLKNYYSRWNVFAVTISGGKQVLNSDILMQYDSKSKTDETTLLWSAAVDATVSMKPNVIKDAASNGWFIIVQDNDNNLYLLDNAGNIIWKKVLSEKVLSNFYTIDLYKNNETQILFNTAGFLFLIDLSGNLVSNYPIRLPAAATNALSLFNFQHQQEYKIYVACSNGKVYAYEGNGKPLVNWNYEFGSGIINHRVQQFDWNGKTCLVISDISGNTFICDETGKSVLKPSGRIVRKLNSDFFLERDSTGNSSLVTFDTTGNIKKILPNGEVETNPYEAVSLSENFILADCNDDGSPEYIFTERDQVAVYNTKMELLFTRSFNEVFIDYVQYFKTPGGKSYIGLCSSVSNKIFLLKGDGTIVNGFPVKGSTPFTIEQLNNDGKNYLVVAGNDSKIYVYSID